MFKKLRIRIILITMSITTAVLVLAGVLIVLFSSTMRPDPKPFNVPQTAQQTVNGGAGENAQQAPTDLTEANRQMTGEQEIRDYIRLDREEGHTRLLVSLLTVGAVIEVAVFLVTLFASRKIVEPVEDAYEKQKLFIANASHELKTPLAIIQANMEALDVNAENIKWKNNIENEIDHANKLVLNLLQLARMDAGSNDGKKTEDVDLGLEIKKRIEMFSPKFDGKISMQKQNNLDSYSLPKQDALQILDILLDNATKYGDKKISIVLDGKGFEVANDGTIVSADDAEKIFDRFYQSDKTSDGSGLGLAIAKALCLRNGWQISCQPDGKKTKLRVDF